MRPLLINTHERGGGAAIAALRLHRGLRWIGVDSRLLVQVPHGEEPGVIGPRGPVARGLAWARPRLESLPVRLYPGRRRSLFSPAWLPDLLPRAADRLGPDLIHLHWVAHGFMRIESLARFGRPLVWTLHDSWAFTGGCHLPFDCIRFQTACGACPALGSRREKDLSRRVWDRKHAAWRGLSITLVTPSRWLADAVRSSALLGGSRCEVIPNGIDLESFRPLDRAEARARCGLALERQVLLCGGAGMGSDPHKGLALLAQALRRLPEKMRAGLDVLVFGTAPGDRLPDAGIPFRDLGFIGNEERLAMLYAAADVFVMPSVHENLPNTVMEAAACGTPCVAFDVGGLSELVEHQRTGWLAAPAQENDLARGIEWVLEDEPRRRALGERARARCEERFDLEHVARAYAELYRELT